MKTSKALALGAIVILALLVIGRFFLSSLSTERTVDGPPGVILSAPPEVAIQELGEVSRTDAARVLAERLGDTGGGADIGVDVGVHFFPGEGREVFLYLERNERGEDVLVERRSGPGSTRLETRWTGDVERRLEWAVTHGSFDAPQLSVGEERNLYH